ncbi:MAG TPA: outer membrane beta-barrel protein [Flavisolibacter sp.]
MKFLILLLLSFTLSGVTVAQSTSRISGVIQESDGKPLQGVTVSLLRAKDSSLAKLALTDKEGNYEVASKDGRYLLSFTAVGFSKTFVAPFDLSGGPVEIPAVTMVAASNSLSAVTVQSRRPLVEARLDKMVVNVDASPTNAGATALEVLEKSPGISVDRDGNISLKGKQGVVVYMDGKQTYLSGADLASLLRNMPASQLDQVEIMTQPSAKYDAAGNAGIINLRTKKTKVMGLNGSISLSYVQGRLPKSPNSFSINYRRGKVNLFGNLSYSHWENESFQTLNRKFKRAGAEASVFYQESEQGSVSNNYNARAGLDYTINPKTTVGFFVNGTLNRSSDDATSIGYIYNFGRLGSTIRARSDNSRSFENVSGNINLRRTLSKPGREIGADLDYIRYGSELHQQSNNYATDAITGIADAPYMLRGVLPSQIQIWSGKVDYTHPLGKGAKLETGYKGSVIRTDNNAPYESYDHTSSKWIADRRRDQFAYDENINAAYVNFSQQWKKWGIQAGLRAEQTASVGKQVLKDTRIARDYLELFPTFYTSYTANDKNSFVLSYGRRLDRPNYRDLNPFQDFLDSFTYNQGNPYLRPQFTNNVELSHNHKGRLNTTFNFTTTNDIMNDILKQNDSTKVTYQTKENVARLRNLGMAVSYNAPIKKWWTTSIYVNLFNSHYEGFVNNEPLDVSITTLMTNMSQQFRFGKGWSGEVNGFFRTRSQATGMFLIKPMGVLSFGAAKQVLKTKGTVKLSVIDPFKLQHTDVYVKHGNIDMLVTNQWDNRRVGLTFTYRFAKGQNVQQRRRSGSAQEEQNRIGAGG